MKRVVCLLLIVLIAYAGCAVKKTSEGPVEHPSPPSPWQTPGEAWESNGVLRYKISQLEMELNRVRKQNEDSLVKIAELEAETESQRAEIESSENVYRLYEIVIESQKVTIETLQKLCRLYEAEKQ